LKLPNEAETFLLGHMVDGDLFKEPAGDGGLARPEHVYLEANLDLLGERPLGEHGLHLQPFLLYTSIQSLSGGGEGGFV
jgi:hypothetical protein